MRLINADELKEKLLQMQKDIAKSVPRGNTKSDMWKAAYLLVFNAYIKMLDEMPWAIPGRDANAILDAYGKGYLKGREDILKEQQQMKDYCKNDCDAIYEAYARGYSKGYIERSYSTLKEIRKEKKMDNSEMTKDKLWSKIIKDLKTLDQEAQNEKFVPLITSLLVMEAEELRTNVTNRTIAQEDKFHMWSLVDDLGCYSIEGETIMYLPEYQDLTALLRKVF